MEMLEKRLATYLEIITGESPYLEPEPVDRTAGLPLFLRERYRLYSLRIFGRTCLFALESPDWEPGSSAEYGSHAQAMYEKLGDQVTIVISAISSSVRNRMVQAGVPFIVPGSQMFLPFLMVDLRERFSRIPPAPGKELTPATQCIFLYHLLHESLAGSSLREIAKKVGYSAMMLSRAKDELEAAELCKTGRKGRSVVLEFPDQGLALWRRAQSVLSSPVKKTHWVKWSSVGTPAVRAGLTALSHNRMIEDDRIPTYALLQEKYRTNLEEGLFHGCPGPSEADVRLEAWTYNPHLLGTDEGVDPLSLFLSLRDSADERVQQQLETLISEVNWA